MAKLKIWGKEVKFRDDPQKKVKTKPVECINCFVPSTKEQMERRVMMRDLSSDISLESPWTFHRDG